MNQIEQDEKNHAVESAPTRHRDGSGGPTGTPASDHNLESHDGFLGLKRPASNNPSTHQRIDIEQYPGGAADSGEVKDTRRETSTGHVQDLVPDRESSLPDREPIDDDTNGRTEGRNARLRPVNKADELEQAAHWGVPTTDGQSPKMQDIPEMSARSPVSDSMVENPVPATSASNREAVRDDLLRSLMNRYLVSEGKYFFRDRQQVLAFEDNGKRISTMHDDRDVARSMIELAEAKGWHSIKLKGSEDFKREAWLEASSRGMQVRGFRPKENDKARLSDMLERAAMRTPNSMEKAQTEGRDLTDEPFDETPRGESSATTAEPQHLGKRQQQELQMLKSLLRERGDSEKAVEMTAALASEQLMKNRNYVGKLLDHGAAPYEHNKDEADSYYVVLDTPRGEKTIWGVDLERAMEEAKVERGTDIVLSQVGRKEVTVPTYELTSDGRRTPEKVWVGAQRNDWEITTIDSMRDHAAARAVAAHAVTTPPQRANQPIKSPTDPSARELAEQRAPAVPDREFGPPTR
jgi:putative DNA primase/helicase